MARRIKSATPRETCSRPSRPDYHLYQGIIALGIKHIFHDFFVRTTADVEFAINALATLIQFAEKKSVPVFRGHFKRKNRSNEGDVYWNKMLRELRNGNLTRRNLESLTMDRSDPTIDQVFDGKRRSPSKKRDRTVAFQFANAFKRAHETTLSWTHPNDRIVRKALAAKNNRCYGQPKQFCIETNDVDIAIQSLKPTRSCGPDGITNILLINLPRAARDLLAEIFNSCITLSYWPNYFKVAKIVPILKSGKTPTDPSNYRPISLTNSLGKIFEKLVKAEIEMFVKGKNIIPPEQFGFRKNHSPTMLIKRITDFIDISKSKEESVGLVKLDVEKASDSVWHDGLIYKLKEKFKFPEALWKLIDSFIRNREFKVYTRGSTSHTVKMPAGLAQGTVLNPLLYTLFVSDIPSLPANVQLAMYADDIAIYTSARNPKDIVRGLNSTLNVLQRYFMKWKIKINADKLQTIIFPTKHDQTKPSLHIMYENHRVPLVQSVKYLGVTLDEMLTYEEHINNVIDKAITYVDKFTPILMSRRLSTETKLLLYITIIRPIMTHGSPICVRAAPDVLNRLDVLQQLYEYLFLPQTIHSSDSVEKRYKLPRLSAHVDRINKRFTKKCEESNYKLINEIARGYPLQQMFACMAKSSKLFWNSKVSVHLRKSLKS